MKYFLFAIGCFMGFIGSWRDIAFYAVGVLVMALYIYSCEVK